MRRALKSTDSGLSYKCVIEISSWLGTGFLEAYVDDPDIKFILTERNPDRWVKSMYSVMSSNLGMASSFPLNILRYFDRTIGHFLELNEVLYDAMAGGRKVSDPESQVNLRRYYVD